MRRARAAADQRWCGSDHQGGQSSERAHAVWFGRLLRRRDVRPGKLLRELKLVCQTDLATGRFLTAYATAATLNVESN